MSRLFFLFWILLSQTAIASTPPPISYAIDGNGQMIDLSGYSLQSDGNKPKRIELRNVENLPRGSEYFYYQFGESDTGGNPVQWDRRDDLRESPEHWDDKTEVIDFCKRGSGGLPSLPK